MTLEHRAATAVPAVEAWRFPVDEITVLEIERKRLTCASNINTGGCGTSLRTGTDFGTLICVVQREAFRRMLARIAIARARARTHRNALIPLGMYNAFRCERESERERRREDVPPNALSHGLVGF